MEFERAIAHAERAEQEQDQPALRLALQQAMELYKGDLLPGCYDEWLLHERDRLHLMFVNVLERLLQLFEQQGEYSSAINVAQHLRRHESLHEASYRHLMRLYAANGNRAAALRVYQTCAMVLQRELAVGPSIETRRVYDWLLQLDESLPFPALERSMILVGNAALAPLMVGIA